jgi:hypothetical protein
MRCVTRHADAGENFAAIDDVRVERALTETAGASVTVEYTVEFVGTQGRGKKPTLQILDVGTSGCSAFSGRLKCDARPGELRRPSNLL